MLASPFIPLGPQHYDELYNQLAAFEPWSILPFDALLRYGFKHPLHRWYAEVDRGKIKGIIYAYHQLLYVLYPSFPAHSYLDWFLSRLLTQFTLCGSQQQLDWVKSQLYSYRAIPMEASYFVVQSDQSLQLIKQPIPLVKGITIRPAVPSDYPSLLELYVGTEVEDEVDPHLIWDLIRYNQVIIAEKDRPVGSVMLLKESLRYALLGGLFVDPNYRQQGVATALGLTMLKRVVKQGKQACFYFRDPAMTLVYQRVGFRSIGHWHIYAFTSK